MPSEKTPAMSFISDVTIGEGEAVPPNTEFLKTWRIQNSGRLRYFVLHHLCYQIRQGPNLYYRWLVFTFM